MTRKEMKTRARQTVKKHYMMLVMVSLIAVFLGLQNSNFDNFVRTYSAEDEDTDTAPELVTEPGEEPFTDPEVKADTRVAVGSRGLVDVLDQIMYGDPKKGKELSEELERERLERSENGSRILGGSRGALSKIVNGITSGSLFVMFVSGINSISGSKNLGSLILIVLALVSVVGFYLLFVNTYTVISARMFLESRRYEKLPIQRFVFLLRVKRWIKVSMAMLRYSIYELLWTLTIIGGMILKQRI